MQLQAHLCRGLSRYCSRQAQRADHKWSEEERHLCILKNKPKQKKQKKIKKKKKKIHL